MEVAKTPILNDEGKGIDLYLSPNSCIISSTIETPTTSGQHYSQHKKDAQRVENTQEGMSAELKEKIANATLNLSAVIFNSWIDRGGFDEEGHLNAEEELKKYLDPSQVRDHMAYAANLAKARLFYNYKDYRNAWHQEAIENARSNGVRLNIKK